MDYVKHQAEDNDEEYEAEVPVFLSLTANRDRAMALPRQQLRKNIKDQQKSKVDLTYRGVRLEKELTSTK